MRIYTEKRWWSPMPGASSRGLRGVFGSRLESWRRDHAGLRKTVDRTVKDVWVVVERLEQCDGEAQAARKGRRRLASLERYLAAHFAREEAQGHLKSALEIAPRYQNRVRSLREEHGELMRDVRGLRAAALEAETSAAQWLEIYRVCDGLAERLHAHDEAENEILMRAVLDDLGAGD
jgi:iron-sulfur cluster repair protein YtfE (RIC family)